MNSTDALVDEARRAAEQSGRAASTPPVPPGRFVRIEAGGVWSARFSDAWAYRELAFFLVWRDLKVRYRQTVFGVAWAVAPPLLFMVFFTIFVQRLIEVPSNGVPYPLFALAALVPWTLVSQTLTTASESLVREANLVSKVYFPRILVPLASAASFLADFAVAMVLLGGLMVFYGVYPELPEILLLPAFTLLAFALAIAAGTWLSALNVMYRDVRAVVPILVQLWLFASPIAYPSSLVPEQWQVVYALNPMVGIVDGFRWALLGTTPPSAAMIAVSAGVTGALLVGALVYFRRVERIFADVI